MVLWWCIEGGCSGQLELELVWTDGFSTRPKLAKDDVGIYQSTGLDVFVRVSQGAMQRSAIFLGQPITGIEGQELDHGSFGQVGRLVNDKPPGLHASL